MLVQDLALYVHPAESQCTASQTDRVTDRQTDGWMDGQTDDMRMPIADHTVSYDWLKTNVPS